MEVVVENVDEALPLLLRIMDRSGRQEESRNGLVMSLDGPIMVRYRYPRERFCMDPRRRNNVAFLVMEGLWMLAGRNDVRWLARFNEQMREYSDDGVTFHGAYGHRLRYNTRGDQLNDCAYLLKKDPKTRRAVAQIWDANIDLCSTSKDIPCNDLIMFRVKDGRLDMTVCNRSNDLIWGMCGANAAHFSMIHEYVATKAGYRTGIYTQVSNNLHMYLDTPRLDIIKQIPLSNGNWYKTNGDVPHKLIQDPDRFDAELGVFMALTDNNWRLNWEFEEPFLNNVAKPLYNFWITRKYMKDEPSQVWMKDIDEIQDYAIQTLAYNWVTEDRWKA